MLARTWAALKTLVSSTNVTSVALKPEGPREGKLNDQEVRVSHSPEVMRSLENLRLARESVAALLVERKQAETVVLELTTAKGHLESAMAARRHQLADRAELPQGAFEEEAKLVDVERQMRTAGVRLQMLDKRLTESNKSVADGKRALAAAFDQFVTERLSEVRARYRATGSKLRELYLEQLTWLKVPTPSAKIVGTGFALVIDPEGDKALIDTRDMAFSGKVVISGPLRDLHDQIQALHSEVKLAISGPQVTLPASAAKPSPTSTATDYSPEAKFVYSQSPINTGYVRRTQGEGITDLGNLGAQVSVSEGN